MAQHRIKAALLGGAALALVAPGAAGAQECAPLLADLEPQLESAELGDEERSRIEQLLTSARLLQEVGREQGCVNIATEVAQMLGGSQGQQGLAAQQAGQPAAGMQQQRQAGTQAQAGGQQQPGTPSAGTGQQQEAGAAGRIEQELEGSLRRARQQLEAAGAGASGAGMAPQIIIRQPAPEVLVRIPEPQVIIKMPEPEVVLQMPDPGVQVLRAEPQVSVEMAQPQVILERAGSDGSRAKPTAGRSGGQMQEPETDPGLAGEQQGAPGESPSGSLGEQPAAPAAAALAEPGADVEVEPLQEEGAVSAPPGVPQPPLGELVAPEQDDEGAGEERPVLAEEEGPGNELPPLEQEGEEQGQEELAATEQPEGAAAGEEGLPVIGEDDAQGQQELAATEEPEGAEQPAAGEPEGGVAEADEAQVARLVQEFGTPDELVGVDVRNAEGKTVAEVIELVRQRTDDALFAVLSVGGFLGLGDKKVAIALGEFELAGEEELLLPRITEDQLKELPPYNEALYVPVAE